jgi:hypothetical protein
MFEQFNSKHAINLSKQFADTAFKAQGLALASIERAFDLQLKTFENRVNAAVEFATEAADVRDIEGVRTLFPKSAALAKDSAEKYYATSQELVGITVKTGEAIGDLIRGSIESANESVTQKPAKKAAK